MVGFVLAAAIVGALAVVFSRRAARMRRVEQRLVEEQLAATRAEQEAERTALRTELLAAHDDAESRIEELEGTIAEGKHALVRARSAIELEHDLNRDLRADLAALQTERGPLGDTSDVRSLVLRVAINLLGAEKGLLLSRQDEDGDGDLDLVCAEGWQHDPEGSAVAQHFAAQVIESDRTIRAEDPEDLPLSPRTPADEEIDNLCAIPIYLSSRFSGVVVCVNKPGGFQELDDEILLTIGNHAGAVLQNARLQGNLRRSYLATVQVLTDAIEAKDRELRTHSSEVSTYVLAVAKWLGLDSLRRERLIFASLLHDIGKIAISELILLKPGPLTPEERVIVEQHPRIGYRLIEQIPELREVATAVLHHHERWDGEGYPAKLRGEEIPVEARLIAVADAFSAMLTDRPYRTGMSVEEACAELVRCAGTQFDPEIVRLFTDEISRRPPSSTATDALSAALTDPEISVRLGDGEHLLGATVAAAIDTIPSLYSHRHLHESAAAEAKRGAAQNRPFAVVIARLSGLAELNQRHGYAAGDAILQILASSVERVASRCGGTAGRESGGRIALLAPGADEKIGEQLGDEIAAELSERDGATRLEVTVGCWRPGETGDAVIRRARVGAGSRTAAR